MHQHLVQRKEGHYVTGRGCGLTTPMKYLKEIPEKLEGHECSFIPSKDVFFKCDWCEERGKIF